MKFHKRVWPRVVAVLVLTIGIASLWGIVVAWSTAIVASLWSTQRQVYESLHIAMDGTPVIVSRSTAAYGDASYRTVAGKPLPNQREEWLTGGTLSSPPQPPVFWESSINWTQRLAGLSDYRRPAVGWYVVRDDQPEGRAYLVGYDEASKRQVGYIGRGGFRPAQPPRDEWFDFGRRLVDWGPFATTGYFSPGGRANPYASAVVGQPRLSPAQVFLIDGNRLLEIDLRERSVRTVYESPRLMAVACVFEPQPAVAAGGVPAAATQNNTLASPQRVVEPRIAVRTADQLVILDPPTGTKREFKLSERLREQTFQVYSLGADEILLQISNYDTRARMELVWLKPDGSIAREEKVVLGTNEVGSEKVAALVGALAAPIPIGHAYGAFVGIPLTMLQSHQAENYREAVARTFEATWPGILVVALLSAGLAWWTHRLQGKYRRPASALWCTFVFLLGLPAFLAYMLESRRPKLEACGDCGKVVPRDREACAACESVFAPPRRLGTEIFA